MQVDYRLRILDDAGASLTPRAGSVHSDPFQVATVAGIAGYKGYMGLPDGDPGSIDILECKAEVGQMTVEILDKRTTEGGSNFSRWVTAFVGDDRGQPYLLGRKAIFEERVDLGAWTPWFTGLVESVELGDRREWLRLSVHGNAETLKGEIFNARPHPDVTYADGCALLPYGPAVGFGGFEAVPRIPATVKAWTATGHGSGFKISVDSAVVKTGDAHAWVTRVHPPLVEITGQNISRSPEGELPDVHVDLFTSLGVLIGTFAAARLPIVATGGRHWLFITAEEVADGRKVRQVGIRELPTTHPRYAPMPAAETAVGFRIVHAGPASSDLPVYVGEVSPVVFMGDVLDGKFGTYLPADPTTPSVSTPRDAAAFAAIESARSFPTGHFAIDQPMKVNEVLEDVIGKPYRLGYRFDGDGELVPVDLRVPASLSGIPTLTNADLFAEPVPGWGEEIAGAIGHMTVRYYIDHQEEPTPGHIGGGKVVPLHPTWLIEDSATDPALFKLPGLGRTDTYEVDAKGFRMSSGIPATNENVSTETLVKAHINALTQEMFTLFSGAMAQVSLPGRRTADVNSCLPGDVRIIDVDEIPDSATNLRGGPRLVRCVGRYVHGERIDLRLVDMGAAVVAVSPSLGTVALVAGFERQRVREPVTLNASLEPAVVWFAVTPTTTSTRPVEGSSLWQFGGRVDATGDVVIDGLPSGSRIWIRGRSEPIGEDLKLPSGWVFPPAPGRIDTQGIPAPTALVLTVDGSDAHVDFTPGDTDLPTEMWLNDGAWRKVGTLAPGSTRASYRALSAGSYTAGLQHIDANAGVSSRTTIAVSISGALQSPDMVGVAVLVGVPG